MAKSVPEKQNSRKSSNKLASAAAPKHQKRPHLLGALAHPLKKQQHGSKKQSSPAPAARLPPAKAQHQQAKQAEEAHPRRALQRFNQGPHKDEDSSSEEDVAMGDQPDREEERQAYQRALSRMEMG